MASGLADCYFIFLKIFIYLAATKIKHTHSERKREEGRQRELAGEKYKK